MDPRNIENVRFKGIKIDNVSFADVHEMIGARIRKDEKGYICMNEVGNVIGAGGDLQFAEAINSSFLSIADGTPLFWFARMVGCRRIERISGLDMMVRMFAEHDGYRHFLLGDTDERIARVIAKAREIDGSLQISGYSPPFRDFDDEDNRMIMDRLNAEAPDIVWVSFGGEKQEKWMFNNIDKLRRGIMVGVGAAFKFFVGDLITPPRFVQKMGLQCLFRIVQCNIQDPKHYLLITFNKVLKRKFIFMWHLPGEVLRSRRELAGRTGG